MTRVPRSRSGITILEVLISIGIATIGLFGVLALIPLASQQTNEGLIADLMSSVGKNAFHKFEIESMGKQERWAMANGDRIVIPPPPPTGPPPLPGPVQYREHGSSFCLDPRRVAADGSMVFPQAPAALFAPQITMDRITLTAGPNTRIPMGAAVANEVFQSQDDLRFAVVDDELPPLQEFTGQDGQPSRNSKRQSSGAMSWLAVLTPKSQVAEDAVIDNYKVGGTDLYNLAVVVFKDRVLQDVDNTAEIVGQIVPANFFSGGFGGGDLRITDVSGGAKLRRGNWVMLSQEVPILGRNNLYTNVHRWYRVVSAHQDPNDSTIWDVTLYGQDWNPNFLTQVTIPKGVVAVYEKTIRLETSSLWTNQ